VTYAINAPLVQALACHCSRCRKAFSGAASANGVVKPGSFVWAQGEQDLNCFEAMPTVKLWFCRHCGTTLGTSVGKQMRGIALGTVDGDPGIALAMHIFVGSKAPWDHMGGDTPCFDEHPPKECP
jgi:hypothetical protein